MKILAIVFLIIINYLTNPIIIYSLNPVKKDLSSINIIDEKIKGYYDNDNLEDYIIKDQKNRRMYSIFINNGKGYTKKLDFVVTEDNFDAVEDPLENLFISNPQKGEIIIGASCCGSFKTTEAMYYKYFEECKNWLFYKDLTSTVEEDFIPSIIAEYSNYSNTIDGKRLNNDNIQNAELKKRKTQNENYFNFLFKKFKTAFDNKSLIKTSGDLNFNDLAELLYTIPINKDNINDYNDLAYYIGLCKDGKTSSIFLLKYIIQKDPSRVVAYLNLGDVQWEFDNKENAKESYQKYISLMKSQGKDLNKIPKRVYDRIK